MEKNYRQKLGAWGESVAVTYLEAHGYEIEFRNWRCRFGEIDIIARLQNTWHFTEVKTRRGNLAGTPEEGLTAWKARRLIQTAQMFLSEHALDNEDWQIDFMAVELDQQGKLLRCEHLPNFVPISPF